MKKTAKRVAILFFMVLTVGLFANDTVKDILKGYEPAALTEEQAIEISEALRVAGFRGGPELDALIRAEGFDPDLIKKLAPPPPRPGEQPFDDKSSEHQAATGKSYESLELSYGPSDFVLESVAVMDGELLEDYKCEQKVNGVEKSIPLRWKNVPEGTQSLAIVMYHFPNPNDTTRANSYLLLWGIDPDTTEIAHGEANKGEWYMGQNKDGNAISYTSPCSPSSGVHEYTIALFALAEYPALPNESSLDVDFSAFMDAIENGDIIGKAELVFQDVNS